MDENENKNEEEKEIEPSASPAPTRKHLNVVVCPKCGSREVAFVTEYHKCIYLRIITLVLAVILIILLRFVCQKSIFDFFTSGVVDGSGYFFLFSFGIVILGLIIAIWIAESKTHVQGICRDCGHIWLLN